LPLSFIYLWLYNGFPLILVVVGSYVMARLIVDYHFDWQPLAYTGMGIALGLVINPYFPDNLLFTYDYLWLKVINPGEVRVGQEWYPYNTWVLFENAWPALILFLSGAFVLGLREQRLDSATATLFLAAALFGLMLFKSRRFIEYYPAFVLLFAALAWAPLLKRWQQIGFRWARGIPLALVLIIISLSGLNLQKLQERFQEDSLPYQRYAAASAWLQANTPAGSRVFQTDWDDLQYLYFGPGPHLYAITRSRTIQIVAGYYARLG
jgi:hypothetical protein